MTTLPTARPAVPTVARPAAAATGAGPMPALDPIKLGKKYKWLLLASAIAGVVLGGISHVVLNWAYPIWTPTHTFLCEPILGQIENVAPTANFEKELEKFMASQVQIMMSDRIIDKSVTDPQLMIDAPKWAAQFSKNGVLDASRAARQLKKKLGASIVGDSYLIVLSVSGQDPDETTAIVRLVARTYMADRKNAADIEHSDRRNLIMKAIGEASTSISQLQTRRSRLLLDQTIETLDQTSSASARKMNQTNEKLVELRMEREMMQSRQKQMKKELEQASGITYSEEIRKKVEEDPSMLRIKDDLNGMEAEMIAARQRLGPNHPQIRKIQTLIDGRRQNMNTERERLLKQYFDGLLDSLTTQIKGLDATEADLLKEYEVARTRAQEITQTLAQVKDIDNEIDRLNLSRGKLGDDLKQIDILTTAKSRISTLQDAQKPRTVSFPKLFIMVPLGMLVVVGLVCGVVLLIEVVDQRVKSPSDIALVPKTRVVGMIPHASEDPSAPPRMETVFRDQPNGVISEHFRQLRSSLLKRMHQAGYKSLVVMSGQPGSGATTVVCNLAQAMASAEQRVLVIDANQRRPSVHRVFGLSEGPGLADVLSGATTLANAVQKTEDPRLSVLAAGAPDRRRPEGLMTQALTSLLAEAGDDYDLILLDVSPASITGDGLAVANRCDASILVVRAFGEKRGMVARLRNDLSEVKAEFLGVLVNAVRSSAGGYLKGNILATHQYQQGSNS